jgi:hypothetical protein
LVHIKQFAVTYEEQKLITDVEALNWADRRAQTLAVRKQKIAAEPTPQAKKRRADRYRGTDPYIHPHLGQAGTDRDVTPRGLIRFRA